jgi:4-amino-4-deoxy-L-arabinose transferase-like glycosyltransferase
LNSPASPAVVILFGVLGFVAVVLFYGVRRPEERRALFAIAVGAYLLKVVLVPLYYWVLVAAGHDGFAYFDAVGYHESAVEMAFEFKHGFAFNSVGWTYKDPGYNVIIAGLYSIFGASTLIARIFNVVIGVFTILYVYRIGCLAFDEQVGKTAAKFAAFLPFTILVTINHRKEAVAIFLATLIFYHALRVVTQQPRWMNSIPVLILFLIPMYFVRGSFVLPFIGLFLVMLFLTQRSLLVGIMLSVLVVVGVIGLQLLAPQGGDLDVQQNLQAMDRMTGKAAMNVAQSEGMLRYVKVTSITDIWKAPFGAFLLVLMPFPPHIIGNQGEAVYVYLLGWAQMAFLIFLPQFFLGLREVFRSGVWKRRLPLVIYSGGFLLVVGGLMVSVLRYRETVFPAILVITAAGMKARSNALFSAVVYGSMALLAAAVYMRRHVL